MKRIVVCVFVLLCFDVSNAVADTPTTTIRLRVRVEDSQGKPIGKPRGTLFKTPPQSNRGNRSETQVVISKQGAPIVGGADGVIETSPLASKDAYVLEVDADGFAPELTQWTSPAQTGTIELPPITLRKLAAIEGTIVDRQGHAVPKAAVIQAGDGPQRLEAVSDERGHFVLQGVPEGKAIVCFDASGYRFWGFVLPCPTSTARIVLERPDDPNPRTLKRAPDSAHDWTAARREAASKKLLEPLVAATLSATVIDETNLLPLLVAARLDPQAVLARMDKLHFARPGRRALILNTATDASLEHNTPEASLAAIAKLDDRERQLDAYLYWFQRSGRTRHDLPARREALKRARELLAASKSTNTSWYRLCRLGSELWDTGDHEAAREVFKECRALLEKMPPDARGREGLRINLAMALARDNVEEAKKLATDLEPGPMLLMAGEIAREHPEAVEEFLANVSNQLSLLQLRGVANNLPELVFRMARHDPAAAERILVKFAQPPQAKSDAESIFGLGSSMFGNFSKELIDFQVLKVKAVCYGLLADAAAKRDPAAARHAVLQAVELVKPLRTGFVHPANQFYHTPAGMMVQLIPVAERIDPALANEIFWRTLSLRISMSGESFDRLMLDVDTPDLVNILRFYDEPLAASLLEPVLSRLVKRSYSGMPTYAWGIQALTLLDPERAIAFPKLLCERAAWDGSLPRNSAIQVIANVLNSDDLWDKDVDRRLHSQLTRVRNVYGAYLTGEDDGS
jgi:hypothetical protein